MDCISEALRAFATAPRPVIRNSANRSLGVRVLISLLFVPVLSALAWSQSQPSSDTDCVDRAAPPPMATFGGPATAAPGHTELGVAVGGFAFGIGESCTITDVLGASDWLVRWRRGMTRRIDFGFDILTSDQADEEIELTTKLAARYQATPGLRLEGGIGAADGGDGRAVNADLAAVIGTHKHPDNTWNYYASIRLGGSHGCTNLFCTPAKSAPGSNSPGALIPLGVLGATARASDTTRFVMEGGLGGTFSREQPTSDLYFHISFGVQFIVGKDRKHAVAGEKNGGDDVAATKLLTRF